MASFRSIDDLDVTGKRVLVRADLNVPMKDGVVTDATRITRSTQTVKDLLAAGAAVILCSHFGRPKGKREPSMSLRPLVSPLAEALGTSVAFAEDCVGEVAEAAVAALQPGRVLLLENLRYHVAEEANERGFAAALASLADIYVNDAFSAAHRAHASTEAVAHVLPAAAGRLMQAELEALGKALDQPKRPVAALVGGAKVSTKLNVLGHLVAKVDHLIIGGGMANTFLHALGHDVGASLCEHDLADTARDIMAKAEAAGCTVVLPRDVVVAKALEANVPTAVVPAVAVPTGQMILDVGPDSAKALESLLESCATLVWNGPLGAFETPPFDAATVAVARKAAALTKAGTLMSVAGGGDTVAALAHAGVLEDFGYVSTAGGAFLEWLEGKTLPGVAALAR